MSTDPDRRRTAAAEDEDPAPATEGDWLLLDGSGPLRRLLVCAAAVIMMTGSIAGLVASDATTASRVGTMIPFLMGVGCLRAVLRRSAGRT